MNVFEMLAEIYYEIDQFYVAQELASGDSVSISRKRELNDHAYFLFMFTRLEDHVREQSSQLILRNSRTCHDWKQRRAWEILPSRKDSDRMPFMNRVALLIEKGSHHYAAIREYYDLRNKIAHGGDFSTPVSIPTVLNDFSMYYEKMKLTD